MLHFRFVGSNANTISYRLVPKYRIRFATTGSVSGPNHNASGSSGLLKGRGSAASFGVKLNDGARTAAFASTAVSVCERITQEHRVCRRRSIATFCSKLIRKRHYMIRTIGISRDQPPRLNPSEHRIVSLITHGYLVISFAEKYRILIIPILFF